MAKRIVTTARGETIDMALLADRKTFVDDKSTIEKQEVPQTMETEGSIPMGKSVLPVIEIEDTKPVEELSNVTIRKRNTRKKKVVEEETIEEELDEVLGDLIKDLD